MQEAYNYIYNIHEDSINTYYRRRNRKKRANKRYYRKQKIFGVVVAAFGILVPFVTDGDATMSLFIIPMALYMIFTKEKVLML